MSENAKLIKINSRIIGTIFAFTLLIPPNIGIDFFGISFEDIPLIFVFFYLLTNKIRNYEIKKFTDRNTNIPTNGISSSPIPKKLIPKLGGIKREDNPKDPRTRSFLF